LYCVITVFQVIFPPDTKGKTFDEIQEKFKRGYFPGKIETLSSRERNILFVRTLTNAQKLGDFFVFVAWHWNDADFRHRN